MPGYDTSLANLVFKPHQPIELDGTRLFFESKTRDGRGMLVFLDRPAIRIL